MTHDTGQAVPPGETPTDRLVAKLGDPDATYTTDQVAYLMAAAGRWATDAAYAAGYHRGRADGLDHAAELNLDAISRALHQAPFSERWHRAEGNRRRARLEADAAAGHPWRGDHPGGPVALTEDGMWP